MSNNLVFVGVRETKSGQRRWIYRDPATGITYNYAHPLEEEHDSTPTLTQEQAGQFKASVAYTKRYKDFAVNDVYLPPRENTFTSQMQSEEAQKPAVDHDPYAGYEEYAKSKRVERQLLGLPYQAEELFNEGKQTQKTMAFMGAGTQLSPGVKPSLPTPKERNLFLESWFESSPWGVFTPEGPPKVSEHPSKKKEILAGKALGEAGHVALWTLAGLGTGKAISSSEKAVEAVGKLGGTSKIAQAIRGALKGVFIGGEAGKALIMHEQGFIPEEIAIDVGGDIASFKGFEEGLKKAVEPKLTELAIQEKAHEQSPHIVYGERGESLGVGLKGTGEEGWKPTVYSAKTKSISVSAIDKQRGWVIEEGIDVAEGKGRVSWIGRVKKFMTSAEVEMSNYNPEKPFIVKDLKSPTVMGGGRSVQISREIITPKEVLTPVTSISGSARSALISAIKSVEWVSLPTTGIGTITLLGELEREEKKRKPRPSLILEELEEEGEITNISPKPSQIYAQAEKEIRKVGYVPITTHKKELEEQLTIEFKERVKPKPTPIQTTKQVEEVVTPKPTPSPEIPNEQQLERQVPITTLRTTTPLLGKIEPPLKSVEKVMPPMPLLFLPRAKPSGGVFDIDIKAGWERKLEWGDIELFDEDSLFGKRSKKKTKSKRGKKGKKKSKSRGGKRKKKAIRKGSKKRRKKKG